MDELTKIKSLYEEYSSVLTKEIEKEINK